MNAFSRGRWTALAAAVWLVGHQAKADTSYVTVRLDKPATQTLTRTSFGLGTQYQVRLPLLYAHLVGGQDEVVFDGASFAVDAAGRGDELGDMARAVLVFRDTAAAKVADDRDRLAAMTAIGGGLRSLSQADLTARVADVPDACTVQPHVHGLAVPDRGSLQADAQDVVGVEGEGMPQRQIVWPVGEPHAGSGCSLPNRASTNAVRSNGSREEEPSRAARRTRRRRG